MTWQHVEDKIVRGRKEYVCCLCGRRIRQGAKHIVRFGFDEGPIRMRMHEVCEHHTRTWDIDDWEACGGDTAGFCSEDLGLPLMTI